MKKGTKKVQLTEEQIYENRKASDIKEIKEDFSRIGYAPNDRKIFEVGEDVYVTNGGFISAKILQILEKDIYEVFITYITNKPYSSEEVVLTRKRILGWNDIFKKEKKECNIEIGKDLYLSFMQQTVNSLIESYVISFGVNFNPPYQRELVWDLEDEQKLIESIFNRVDIGKFVFIKLPYSSELLYEILDGKQRLTTLYRFYTDQFTYKGYYYSELPIEYKYLFTETSVAVAVTRKENLSEKDVLNYFLRLNTSGKVMDAEHLNNIKNKFEKL